jgi:Protein of unknown function (DUF1559)
MMRRIILMLVALSFATSTRAADSPSNEVLSWIPADAAVFVHANVKQLWDSPIAQRVVKANPNNVLNPLMKFASDVGIPTENVQTFTLCLPKLKGPGDDQAIVVAVTLNKPYDAKKLVATIHKLGDEKKFPETFSTKRFTAVRENVYAFTEKVNNKDRQTRFHFDHPQRIVLLGYERHDFMKPIADQSGPLAEAITLAKTNPAISFGLNWAQLPDEIRQENNLPPQVEPFKPLIMSDAIIAQGRMTAENLTLQVQVKCGNQAKSLEAEKSLGVLRVLLQTVLNAGIIEGEKQKDESLKPLLALGREVQTVLKNAKFASNETQATAELAMKTDLDLVPLVKQLTGSGAVSSAAARSRTQNNLKQLALAMHGFHDAMGSLPPPATLGKKGKLLQSWRVQILPFIEQDALYRKFKLEEAWDSEHNKMVFETNPMPPVFAVEGVTKPGEKTTHFQVFRGNGAMFDVLKATKFQHITDGTSNTIMIAQAKSAVQWTKPDDLEFDPKLDPRDQLLFVNDLTQVSFADGSVRAFRKNLSAETIRSLITKSGGEVASIND